MGSASTKQKYVLVSNLSLGMVTKKIGVKTHVLCESFLGFSKNSPTTLPKTNSSHLKIGRNPKGKANVFQPPFFRGKLAVSFREGNPTGDPGIFTSFRASTRRGLKLFWAPIVDAAYVSRIGRRWEKTVYLKMGVFGWGTKKTEYGVKSPNKKVAIWILVFYFFLKHTLYFKIYLVDGLYVAIM